jgi:hypothetical protein
MPEGASKGVPTLRYVHLPEGSDEQSGHGVRAHWGERTASLRDRDVLYLVTDAVVDTVCCGDRVFHYATVLGYVTEWKTGKDASGLPVSFIEPVADPAARQEIEDLLKQDDAELQVSFRPEEET